MINILLSSMMVTWVVAGEMDTLVEGDIRDSSTEKVFLSSASSFAVIEINTSANEFMK